MARVRFLADFDYRPRHGVMIAYRAGMELTVRRECADQAIALGKAEEADPPTRPAEAAAFEIPPPPAAEPPPKRRGFRR